MTTTSSNVDRDTRDAQRAASPRADVIGGGALGLLLGMLVGLSATPIVSTVVTALVALLAGLFGLSDKVLTSMPAGAARRLAGFGIAATLAIPVAVWMRTSDVLAPSVQAHKAALVAMGITDPREQKELLKFQRFGIVPSGSTLSGKESDPVRQTTRGVLYAIPAGFCANLARLKDAPTRDYKTLFESGSEETAGIARAIAALPAERQRVAYEAAPLYLCNRD